ncbi:unnamed protein product [Closterium sp. Naga37s-1]|nr:unnamed protein product [Closterium sp. Naga37s-1]
MTTNPSRPCVDCNDRDPFSTNAMMIPVRARVTANRTSHLCSLKTNGLLTHHFLRTTLPAPSDPPAPPDPSAPPDPPASPDPPAGLATPIPPGPPGPAVSAPVVASLDAAGGLAREADETAGAATDAKQPGGLPPPSAASAPLCLPPSFGSSLSPHAAPAVPVAVASAELLLAAVLLSTPGCEQPCMDGVERSVPTARLSHL